MRIGIYGINYAPELTGIGKYTAEMCEWLAEKGHEVTVFTGLPYYPEWQIHENYRKRWFWLTEYRNNVKTIRTPLYVPKKPTSFTRILLEVSFIVGVIPLWIRSIFSKKYDIIISITPPFHLGILPMIYCKLRGAKFITHVQDLQIDAARNLKMINNTRLLNIMFKIESYLFTKSDLVTTISDGMKLQILDKGIAASKLALFPNWVDVNFIRPLSNDLSLRAQFGLKPTDKVVLYSGNLGEKQGLEIIPQVAQLLRERQDIHFLIVGSGGSKATLQETATQLNLSNLHFHPLAPYKDLPALLATADVHLVLQKKSASDLVLPSKLTGIFSSGGCAVVTAEPGTSLFNIITNHKIGFIVEPEDPNSLKQILIEALASDLTEMKGRARQYALNNLSQKSIMQKFEELLFRLQRESFKTRNTEVAA